MYLAKTVTGQKAFKDRSVLFSPRQRSAFIMFDGKHTVAEVLNHTAGLGLTREEVDRMVELGWLAQAPAAAEPVAMPLTDGSVAGLVELQEAQSRYRRAYPLATQLTASIGLRGFRLNLAVEAAGSYPQLLALFPKIRETVGGGKTAELEMVLSGSM